MFVGEEESWPGFSGVGRACALLRCASGQDTLGRGAVIRVRHIGLGGIQCSMIVV